MAEQDFRPPTDPVANPFPPTPLTAGSEESVPPIREDESWLTPTLLTALLAPLLFVAAGLLLYHQFFAEKAPRFGLVDVAGAISRTELVYTEMLSRPTTTDKERGDAYDLIKTTGEKIEKSLTEIQRQCDCVLLARAAVVGQPLPDFTPQLYKDLGIDNIREEELRLKIAQYAAAKPTPVDPDANTPLGRAYSSFLQQGGAR